MKGSSKEPEEGRYIWEVGGSDSEEGVEIASWERQFAGFDASPKLKVLFKFALVKASTSTKHQAQVENPEKKEHLRALCSLRL